MSVLSEITRITAAKDLALKVLREKGVVVTGEEPIDDLAELIAHLYSTQELPEQVKSDWLEDDENSYAFILNKPVKDVDYLSPSTASEAYQLKGNYLTDKVIYYKELTEDYSFYIDKEKSGLYLFKTNGNGFLLYTRANPNVTADDIENLAIVDASYVGSAVIAESSSVTYLLQSTNESEYIFLLVQRDKNSFYANQIVANELFISVTNTNTQGTWSTSVITPSSLIDAKITPHVTDEHINSLIDIKIQELDGTGDVF